MGKLHLLFCHRITIQVYSLSMKNLLIVFALLVSFPTPFTQKKTWVAIGDSITYLNDHRDETGNRISKGYLTLVQEKFDDLQVINKGYNGWTAVRIATEFEKLEIPKADIYSIFLGTNDWWGGRPLGTFKDYQNNTGVGTVNGAFRVIVENLKKINPEAQIILITPMKRVDFVYINNYKNNAFGSYRDKNGQSLESFAEAIKAIGEFEGFPIVDLFHQKKLDYPKLIKFKELINPVTKEYEKYRYPDFIDIPFDPDRDTYPYPESSIGVTYDGLHPSDKGYKIIARELYPIFSRIQKK